MEKISLIKLSNSFLITLPLEYRNSGWAEAFGEIQEELRNISSTIDEVIINSTKCKWADPLPLLSEDITVNVPLIAHTNVPLCNHPINCI